MQQFITQKIETLTIFQEVIDDDQAERRPLK